jgi:hypothetical protein
MVAKIGRPTKYCQEILDRSFDYFENYERYGDAVPSQGGLSSELDIARSTLKKWGKEPGKEEFSAILAKIKMKQERVLLNKGLLGEFNSNIVKLMLGKHGYSNRAKIENVGRVYVGPLVVKP